jgi:hypothetical protein
MGLSQGEEKLNTVEIVLNNSNHNNIKNKPLLLGLVMTGI